MINGNLVALSAVEKEDLRQFRDWRNNPNFNKHFREYRQLSMRHQEQWFEEKIITDPGTMMFSIRRMDDGELLGCCGFVYINWIYRHADLSLYIGWDDTYIDNNGYAEESCRLLLDQGFKELCLNKIWTEIYEFDEKKRELYERFGFQQDGLLRENYWHDGKWWNSIIISLLSREYLR